MAGLECETVLPIKSIAKTSAEKYLLRSFVDVATTIS